MLGFARRLDLVPRLSLRRRHWQTRQRDRARYCFLLQFRDQMMAIDWQRWDAMRASLDYCWLRMSELARIGPEGREEYEAIVEHATSTADRLLEFAGAPPVSTAQMRAQWRRGRTEVMGLRERIAEAGIAQMERYDLALESARADE